MKALTLINCLFFLVFSSQAQIETMGGKSDKKCYEKSLARKGQRFADFECGKTVGVLDCNDKLELDEGSGMILTKGTGKPFNGTCETCHSNGLLEHKITFVNGREEGIDTTNYESGCLMVVRQHIGGKEHGKWTYFYDSTGYTAWEMNYALGEKNGQQIYFSPKGDTTLWENYKNGILHGPKKTYNKRTKKLEKEAFYVNGLLEGAFIVYNEDGKIIQKLNYKQGKKNGVCSYYYDDGVLLRTENWEMDAKNGEFKSFFYNQTIESIENYKKASGKPEQYVSADIYTCANRDVTNQVLRMITDKKPSTAIIEAQGENVTLNAVKRVLQEDEPTLKGKKLIKGINEPIKNGKEGFIVIHVTALETLTKNEVREGWFEERFSNGKIKRRALYKKDVLLEEHVFNAQGKEIKTFGGQSTSGSEDDEMPTNGKKKKK